MEENNVNVRGEGTRSRYTNYKLTDIPKKRVFRRSSGGSICRRTNLVLQKEVLSILLLLGTVLYFISILWINFHAKQWYSFDIYSDALLARIMVEQKTIFPENWVFGNQYYVIATPVLAAGLYALFHDTVFAMSLASSIMTVLILLCFLWAVKPFTEQRNRLVGLFSLSGAVLLGSSASSYVNGFEYFYTMASFYSCYIIVILLTLGIYYRFRLKKKIHPIVVLISEFFSIALGMQSLRGMLVLYLPLLTFTILMILLRKSEKISALYAASVWILNIIGIIIINYIPLKSAPIISKVSLSFNPSELLNNFKSTTSELMIITGLKFCTYGIKWLPLFVIAVCFAAIVVLAIYKIIKCRKGSMIEGTIVFCWISVLAVYAVGILMFRVRAIYFFIWYLLVVFSFIYVVKEYNNISKLVMVFLLLAGFMNYITNFYPDFSEYAGRNTFYQKITNELMDEGINCVYYDLHTSPLFAVFSKDQIVSGTVQLDPNGESGGLMHPVNYLKPLDVFRNADKYNSYIIFSNWTFDYLKNTSAEYVEKLLTNLQYCKKVSYKGEEFKFYKFSPDLLNYSE